jgi:hypothetical protein
VLQTVSREMKKSHARVKKNSCEDKKITDEKRKNFAFVKKITDAKNFFSCENETVTSVYKISTDVIFFSQACFRASCSDLSRIQNQQPANDQNDDALNANAGSACRCTFPSFKRDFLPL